MCDILVRVLPGRILFGKNSDREPNEAQWLEWHPPRDHPPGARVRCTHIEIPQAAHTHGVLISRPFWMWGAEMGTNEHGLTIGNTAVFTRERVARTGLTGMDLVRLALERATGAVEAVECIRKLIEAHGQGGACGYEKRRFRYHSAFAIADPREAFLLETTRGDLAVHPIREVAAISNRLSDPAFAARHGDPLRSHFARAKERAGRVACIGASADSVEALAAILRDHGAGRSAPEYDLWTGALRAPCAHAGGLLAATQTTASWISELGADAVRHFATGTAAPCIGVFKPVSVETPVDLGRPSGRFDGESLFWRHERLHRRVLRDPGRFLRRIADDRTDLEARVFAGELASSEAFSRAEALLADWTRRVEAEPVADMRPPFVRAYWARQNTRAGLPR
ncbi:MAG: acyl-CoA--6-aminopenicillanic acid acyltransferase [Deltaproteobacteria bacterium]|nr:MAG: acyl-CoA--6-aminopenicillanic acid acyltransferase [Deltaproteobacteria bacterium]